MPLSREEKVERVVEAYEKTVVKHINEEYQKRVKRSDRIADAVSFFAGSWRFILIFAGFLVLWIIWNIVTPKGLKFDPAPFILLNLLLSFLAGFQAPFIMMSQNRAADRAKIEADVDYAINYKAEDDIEAVKAQLKRMEHHLHEIEALLKAQAGS